ncbi:MAG: tRNA (guanosine(37)-N1)-methyltransferase TrmD [Patescibacteria group bacterium]|nr:tRNA (guanosine(37)-N1)-methyltransferase TrmD [Patescibacteria group bacterium]
MQFEIITIFPKIFDSYFNESILARARKEKLIKINTHNLRDYTSDKHKTVDDTPYGGGAGMVLKVEPIYKALVKIIGESKLKCFRKGIKSGLYPFSSQSSIERLRRGDKNQELKIKNNSKNKTKIILLSAKGKKFDQAMAKRLSKLDKLVLICGRYEGVDERVAKNLADEEISAGDYILTGGEIPAMIIVDAVSRLIKGVVGNEESIKEESFSKKDYLEYPHYTRPENFSPNKKTNWKVPAVLLSGNHKNIQNWKEKYSKNNF